METYSTLRSQLNESMLDMMDDLALSSLPAGQNRFAQTFDSRDLAAQVTLLDAKYFKAIRVRPSLTSLLPPPCCLSQSRCSWQSWSGRRG